MFSRSLFKEMFFILVVIFILNTLALQHDWYWSIEEFDSLVHFLGGAWASLFVLWIYFFSALLNPQRREFLDFLSISFLGTILIGAVWEIFELVSGSTFVSDTEYPFDTTLDFVMDILGSLAACLYAYMKEVDNKHKPQFIKGKAPENLPV